LAKQSDKLRESIPDGYLRTLYDLQVGGTKGTYGSAKSLIGTGVDAAFLLQKLTSPVGWLDPDLQRKVQQGFSFGFDIGKAYAVLEFGTLQEKKQLLQHLRTVVEGVYEDAKNSVQRQLAEAKRTGKQDELIAKWIMRILLEAGTVMLGASGLKGARSAAEGLELASDGSRVAQAGKGAIKSISEESEASKLTQFAEARELKPPTRITFGHGARHLAGTGLERGQVENAIAKEVQATAKASSSTGNFWGKVVVEGQEVYYRAFTLSDGTINIGTYTVGAP